MKVNSYMKSLITGAIIGVIQLVVLTMFMATILYLTNGEGFFHKAGTHQSVGNIHLDDVNKIGYIIAAVLPLTLLRYTSVKYMPLLILSSIFSYCLTFLLLNDILFYIFSCNLLGGLDVLHFGGWIFPVGALCGTVLAVIINARMNYHKKKK